MKTLKLMLLSVGILALADQVLAQNDQATDQRKPLNNPMYSTHNYKHPNLAAAARRWENKQGVEVKTPAPGDARLANYKNQMPRTQPVGGVTVDHTPSANLADRNYKIQRISEPGSTGASNEYYVKKQKRKNDSTAIGE
ncbi:hypothetical protein [Spirosoma sp. KNUC1025]|uniref:hypothetical protein n=1 Tax=Spirosoma sp. KNUC1025 TaxID=2894082 RepID=UPI00386A7BB8|nr:hypothetical protein LN737_20625 [Spirosoma sp. KNUC1025]